MKHSKAIEAVLLPSQQPSGILSAEKPLEVPCWPRLCWGRFFGAQRPIAASDLRREARCVVHGELIAPAGVLHADGASFADLPIDQPAVGAFGRRKVLFLLRRDERTSSCNIFWQHLLVLAESSGDLVHSSSRCFLVLAESSGDLVHSPSNSTRGLCGVLDTLSDGRET